jgi:preprotein translocase subunit SecA
MIRLLERLAGNSSSRTLKRLQSVLEQANKFEPEIEKLDDDKLRAKTKQFQLAIQDKSKSLDDLLPEAFACVREAARRTLKQRHFDVQVIGGVVLHQGKIAEMRTGEGKTLAATLAVYLNALEGKGVHVVTVNDYLARRDASWMGQVYNLLGLSVACIQHESALLYDTDLVQRSASEVDQVQLDVKNMVTCSRKEAYETDITYGTNNEFGFDYLRDNMVADLKDKVQRDLHFAIIDEVDSILIDEARTPLIISAPAQESTDQYMQFAKIVRQLDQKTDFNIDEKDRTAALTDEGLKKVEKLLNIKNVYEEGGVTLVHHLEEALKAEALFKRDKHYVVKENEIVIVDEFTGRLMPGRRYSEGLHQAIEAKEGVEVKRESVTLATISLQNYFRLYVKLAGMTGTAMTETEEFYKIYGLEVVVVPTHRPIVRDDKTDRIYKNERGKLKAVVDEIRAKQKQGQPILVGTSSIEKNEELSKLFKKSGIKFDVLNAKNHEREARIVAQAGQIGAVTLATNIAGRGVDIILGGSPYDKDKAEKVKALGGVHVIGTERHESRRIDNQFRGRSGRQGDPGSTQFYVSMEDDLMRIFGGDRIASLMDTLKLPEDQPIENSFISRSIESAQKRVEGHNFDIRKHLVEYDDVLNRHRDTIYKKRNQILSIENPKEEIISLFEDEIEELVKFHTQGSLSNWNTNKLSDNFHVLTGTPIQESEIQDLAERSDVQNYLLKHVQSSYAKRRKELGDELMNRIEKSVYLRAIDTLWVEHLTALDNLRTGIGLRGYAQKDPLAEYKSEAFRMYKQLMDSIREQVLHLVMKAEVTQQPRVQEMPRTGIRQSSGKNVQEFNSKQTEPPPTRTSVPGKKFKDIGRNDPCPCGAINSETGQVYKYKKCGMINASYHKN